MASVEISYSKYDVQLKGKQVLEESHMFYAISLHCHIFHIQLWESSYFIISIDAVLGNALST